jgi:hypothetical protein
MPQADSVGRSITLSCLVGVATLGFGAGCTSMDDPPGGEQCVPLLSYSEVKKRCGAAFNDCLASGIQSIRSLRYGHSQCIPCRDLCMQNNGVWPDAFEGVPCI